MSKPSLARGTRDFGPDVMIKRSFILDSIKKTYQKYGFLPLETPSIENLSVLMGKYGDEGDQLLFKILNSGDFAKELDSTDLEKGSKTIMPKISDKGLRYDLTVPFARYVVMNRHSLAMPFKRYQVQPVWRADRPQKGRYREFYQCDADVVGSQSLLCEAEIVMMLQDVFSDLGLKNYAVKINNRKVLTGIADTVGANGKESDLCVAIDKLDKIGKEEVEKELLERGFTEKNVEALQPLFNLPNSSLEVFSWLRAWLKGSETGLQGVEELSQIWTLVSAAGYGLDCLSFDPSLARGLSYYTGAIFEVKALDVSIGSISGGGRYDNLTGTFGMPGLSGVGISLGVDRIYDVMEELSLFPQILEQAHTRVLLTNFDEKSMLHGLEILSRFRKAGIASELYPEHSKLKKQFEYADKKRIPFVLLVGDKEIEEKQYALKNMQTGTQNSFSIDQLITELHV
jgi:histidyl-tRNA synthetase